MMWLMIWSCPGSQIVISQWFPCETVPLLYSSLITQPMDPKHSVIKALLAAPVAEWLRQLIFSALNCSWVQARITYETSRVLLAGGQVFFLGDLPFSPHLKMSEIILMGRI